MTRWSHLDSDSERLPDDLVRIGYDADTQQYTFQGSDGSIWEGPSGSAYGNLTRISGPPTRTTTTAGPSSRNRRAASTASEGDYGYFEEVYEEDETDYEYGYVDGYGRFHPYHTAHGSEEHLRQAYHGGTAGPSHSQQQTYYRRPNTSGGPRPSPSSHQQQQQQQQQYYRGQPSTSERWRPAATPRGNITRVATEHHPSRTSRSGGESRPRSTSHRQHGQRRPEQVHPQQQRQDERLVTRRTVDTSSNAAEHLAHVRRESRRRQIARDRQAGNAAGALRALVGRVRLTLDSVQNEMRQANGPARQRRPSQTRPGPGDQNTDYNRPGPGGRDRRETM